MRVRLEATPQELADKGAALIKALVVELYPVSEELAENLEKALPAKEPALKYKALRDIHRITKEEYQKTLERVHLDIAKVLSEAADATSVGQTLEKGESLEKSMGPFIGPRGGKWADPQHTIPWHPDVPHEQIQQDAHAVVQPQVVQGAMRAAAAGAHAPSLKYVNSGGEGMVYADEQGKAHKVSRHRRPGNMQPLRNEAEANQALMGTPAEQYVTKVHNYDPKHDVLTRDYVAGRQGGWGSKGLREAYDVITKELAKKGWGAPEFKEDSFIHPEGGGPPKMVDLGFVHPRGATLAARLKERIAKLDPKDDFFDIQLDANHAYDEGAIDLPTAMGYVDQASKKVEHADPHSVESAKDILASVAKRKGDLKEGQTWKDVKLPKVPLAEPATLGKLKARHETLSDDAKEGAYFKDRNTSLLNARGAELRERDPKRPMTARFSMEGFKAFNDEFGHEVPDGALRIMGHALSQNIPDGVKRGGDIEGDVTDQGHADQIAEQMSRAIDPSGRIRVVATAVERGPDTATTLAKLGDAHKAHKDAEVDAGKLGHRLKLPVGLGSDPKKAKKAMASIAKRMGEAKPGKGAELGEAHHAAFSQVSPDEAFSTVHQEQGSGLLSEDGFHHSLAAHPEHHVASADLRGIGVFNQAFGKAATDSIMKEFSALMARHGGHDVNAAHPHGDEYAAHHASPKQLKRMFAKLKKTTDKTVLISYIGNGKVVIQRGLHFAYGVGRTFDEADRINLKKAKEEQGAVPTPETLDRKVADREIAKLKRRGHTIFQVGGDVGPDDGGSGEGSGPGNGGRGERAGQEVTKSMDSLCKAQGGPFIGPRGGKWADAAHTISWEEAGDASHNGVFRYGAHLRPVSHANVPKGATHEPHAAFRHGQAVYDRPLTPDEISSYELTPILNDRATEQRVARALDQMHEYANEYRDLLAEDPKTVEVTIRQALERQGPAHYDVNAAVNRVIEGLKQTTGAGVQGEPKVGDTLSVTVHPAISGREDDKSTYRVLQTEGDKVKVGRYEGSDYGPWMPKSSLKHFQNDLAGRVDLPPSGNPDIDAVTSGKAKFLGKGDDGMAFKHGDKVVKVSTTVPYQPENPGHRSPEQAADMLKQQVAIGNELADAGVPGIQRSEFVKHGDKGFQIKPWVEIPEKFTREQLDAVQDSLIGMHKQGYALNDDPQAGLDANGKVVMFDVGKAAKGAGDPKDHNSAATDDMYRLGYLYKKHGQEFVRRDFSEGQRLWENYQGRSLAWMRDKKSDLAKYNLDLATQKLEAEARATIPKGIGLDVALAKIKKQHEEEIAFWGTISGDKPKDRLTLTPTTTEKLKPKARTPVRAKQNPEDAPLPGQRSLLDPQRVVARKPERPVTRAVAFAEIVGPGARHNRPGDHRLSACKRGSAKEGLPRRGFREGWRAVREEYQRAIGHGAFSLIPCNMPGRECDYATDRRPAT